MSLDEPSDGQGLAEYMVRESQVSVTSTTPWIRLKILSPYIGHQQKFRGKYDVIQIKYWYPCGRMKVNNVDWCRVLTTCACRASSM